MMKSHFSIFVIALLATGVPAQTRTSADYSVAAEIADGGGAPGASANYNHTGSTGGVSGISSVTSPSETAKQGYVAQLYEMTALQISASPTTVNEGTERQLSGTQLLDDVTTIAVSAGSITWSVQAGPLAGVSAGGIATAGNVHQDTPATVQGSLAGFTATLNLTVVNIGSDDFGTYAGDGIADDWQVQYFDENNPNAAPALDPDGDGHSNLFEYTAGIVPTDPLSAFAFRIEPVSGQPSQKKLTFSPRLDDRAYAVQFRLDLANSPDWATLINTTQSDSGEERTITDLSGTEVRKFYRVLITKP